MTILSSLIPKDAPYTRSLFDESLQAGRLKGFASGCFMVPLAGVQVPIYALRGIKNCVVSILHLEFRNGIHSFCTDEFSALKCLALTVGSIAYAVLKLLCGSLGKPSLATVQDTIPAPPAPYHYKSSLKKM